MEDLKKVGEFAKSKEKTLQLLNDYSGYSAC